jgi:hypothetical protein
MGGNSTEASEAETGSAATANSGRGRPREMKPWRPQEAATVARRPPTDGLGRRRTQGRHPAQTHGQTAAVGAVVPKGGWAGGVQGATGAPGAGQGVGHGVGQGARQNQWPVGRSTPIP